MWYRPVLFRLFYPVTFSRSAHFLHCGVWRICFVKSSMLLWGHFVPIKGEAGRDSGPNSLAGSRAGHLLNTMRIKRDYGYAFVCKAPPFQQRMLIFLKKWWNSKLWVSKLASSARGKLSEHRGRILAVACRKEASILHRFLWQEEVLSSPAFIFIKLFWN